MVLKSTGINSKIILGIIKDYCNLVLKLLRKFIMVMKNMLLKISVQYQIMKKKYKKVKMNHQLSQTQQTSPYHLISLQWDTELLIKQMKVILQKIKMKLKVVIKIWSHMIRKHLCFKLHKLMLINSHLIKKQHLMLIIMWITTNILVNGSCLLLINKMILNLPIHVHSFFMM